MRSNILSKLIFASCVWYSDRTYYGLCVLIKDIGRRLPLQLQCSCQGQQVDVRQSVRGNYKTRFWGGQNLTAVEGNASVYQVNPVISGEGRAEFVRTWGPDFDQKGGGRGGKGGLYIYIYEQSFGIFMGTSSAPDLANDLHLCMSSNS